MDLRIDFLTRLFSFALIGDRVDLCGDNVGIADVFLGNEFAFVLDTKQALRAGEKPLSFLNAAGSNTVHVHISDSGERGDCLLIGKGSFRFREFFDRLNVLNPDASIILELYRSGFNGISDLVSSYNILTRMIGQSSKGGEL